MFDHYLHHQAPDSRRNKILATTTTIACVGTGLSLAFMWVAGKLAVSTVDPPTIAFIMVQMNQEEAPPPPPPPPPPAGNNDAEEEEEEVEEEIPEEEEPIEDEIAQPDEVKEKIPDAKPGKKSKKRFTGGVVGGVPGGVAGGVVGGVVGGITGGVRSKAKAPAAAKKPLSAVMANRMYQPPKPKKELLATPTGKFGKRPGTVLIAFCISPTGKVVNVKVKKGFPGDPQVTKIMSGWLKKFRFRPFKVGGKAQKICTEYAMNVKFAG